MDKKEQAYQLIKNKLEKDSYMSYKEISQITGYHPKYLLKLKREILEGNFKLEHGNKNKKSPHSLPQDEVDKIIGLYKRSHASIRKFCKFYNKRSYSCIYNVLKENNLINSEDEVSNK